MIPEGWDRKSQLVRHLGLPNKKDVIDRVIGEKIGAHHRPCQGKINSSSSSIRKSREYHDGTLPQEGAKLAHFCSMCGPHFCSMKITETGLLLNFGASVQVKRKFREYKPKESMIDSIL